MKFWKVFKIFWIIYLLFFAIGLPLILHYAGDHHQNDYQMINTSASEAYVLLGLGTALWLIVFIYYIKQFLINLLLKKNDIIRKPYRRRFEVGNTTGIELDRETKPTYIGIDGQMAKSNAKTIVFTIIGLLLLIALAAGILVYSYINESHGYGWRYLYFWHPYIMIPGSFIFYLSFLFGITNVFFSKYLGKSEKLYMLLFRKK